jgi:hypothetical protein
LGGERAFFVDFFGAICYFSKDKLAEEIPQYTILPTVISDKYPKAQLRK